MRVKFGFFLKDIAGAGLENWTDLKVAKIVRWFVKVDDIVTQAQSLAEVETDKITMELYSSLAGKVVDLNYEEGEEWHNGGIEDTPFGELVLPELGVIETEKNIGDVQERGGAPDTPKESEQEPMKLPEKKPEAVERAAPLSGVPRISPGAAQFALTKGISLDELTGHFPDVARITREHVRKYLEERHIAQEPPQPQESTGFRTTQIRAVPRARALARERGITLSNIRGTGPEGLITVRDVEKPQPAPQDMPLVEDDRILAEVSMLRKTVARLLEKGWKNIPLAGDGIEVEITKLVDFRMKLKARWQKEYGRELRYEHFFAYILVKLLTQERFSAMNSFWDDSIEDVYRFSHVNLGIAVHTERGLTLPVIRNAGALSFDEFVRVYEDTIARAIEGKAKATDFRDATCIFNNVGAGGGEDPSPIIPYVVESSGRERPLSLLFATARARKTEDGRVLMKVVVRFDHRVVDGKPALELMHAFREMFEGVFDPIEFAVLFR